MKNLNNLNKRWINEYVHSLERSSHKKTKRQAVLPSFGAVLLLNEYTKNKAQLSICMIIEKVKGRDRII